ncbi:MAG: NDP-sugar synthase [Chloroflexi bacterium]|nr:NDP-sugar synthase [Chloroflexota bacterium]
MLPVDASAPNDWYDTGVYIFEPEIFAYIPERTYFDIQTQLIPALRQAGLKIGGFETQGYWNTLATFQAYHEAQKHILQSAWHNPEALKWAARFSHPIIDGRQISAGIWVGRNHIIDPSGTFAAPGLYGA